jgi:hypothetical protein
MLCSCSSPIFGGYSLALHVQRLILAFGSQYVSSYVPFLINLLAMLGWLPKNMVCNVVCFFPF